LLLVFTANKFVDYLGDAASGRIPADFVFRLLWLRMLAMQTEVLPMLIFLAVILAFARLNQDNELAVLAAAGIGKRQQLKIVLRFTLVFSLLVAFIAFFAAPWAKMNISKLKIQAWQEANITGLTEGKFKEIGKGNSVVYIEDISTDKNVMKKVFLQIQDKDKNNVVRSDSAYFDVDKESGNRFIVFKNGRRYLGQPGTQDYQITEYEKYAALVQVNDDKSEVSSTEATATYLLLGSKNPKHRAELQWRISSIVICVLLAILGVLLNQYPFGQKPFTLLLVGILIYFIYNNLLSISRTLLEKEHVPSYLGVWWVHTLLILAVLIIYNYQTIIQRNKRDTIVQILTAEK
jgi:lipopolysaccharide export system permease protein